ncbi:MAG: hypothetical protein ACKO37_07305 [Vampirovibrionales bacterium]
MLNVQTQTASMMQQRLMMQKLQQKLAQVPQAQPKLQAPQARFGSVPAPLVEDTFQSTKKFANKLTAPLEGNIAFQMPHQPKVAGVFTSINNLIRNLLGGH